MSDGFEPMYKTLIVEGNVTFRQMVKESLRSRFPELNFLDEIGKLSLPCD